ncbi:PLP-dependent transferase [Panaeolus papilionaceus]|nr:PLP-dependent transferase [Panaeolus papilionaceus]
MSGHNEGSTNPLVKVLPDSYYDTFFSDEAKLRKPSPIHSLVPLQNTPGIVSLLAGSPNPDVFPFRSLIVHPIAPDGTDQPELTLEGKELKVALQYGETPGFRPLLDWITGLQEFSHGRKRDDNVWRVSMGSGSQDVIYKAAMTIFNTGDPILIESPVYAGVLPIFNSCLCEKIEVETDLDGICSTSLKETLENWPAGKPKPKALYTVPYGSNPTGMTAALERRLEVLKLAKEHNFMILEGRISSIYRRLSIRANAYGIPSKDDPYFYLYYGKAARPLSYFALEPQIGEVGRVLRFDSFSKILSGGMRIGCISGPTRFLDVLDQLSEFASLQVPTLTQAIVFKLLSSWGYEGFVKHTERASALYRDRRDMFEEAMRQHLTGLAEWKAPEAGMFLWFKLILDPNSPSDADTENTIRTIAFKKGVLALPGTIFLPNGGKSPYVRASFSILSKEQMHVALSRLREAILEARETLQSERGL